MVFLDGDPGPEIRRKLNEMVGTWEDAILNAKGWSPVLSVVSDGQRRVLQIADWVGGIGTKPATGQYVGATGLVTAIASAVDIRGPIGLTGPAGPPNTLAIGTVVTGISSSATITGTSPNQILNLTLQKGDKGDTGNTGPAGPPNTLAIGTVTSGASPSATITGTSPNQTLNLTLQKGDKGDTGWTPILAIIDDGVRRVQQVVDWAGGQGAKPATGQYVGITGLVTDIALAVDIRGPAGTGNVSSTGAITADSIALFADTTGSVIKSFTPAVYPDIRPTLNLDFANSKTVDPRITSARASTATYFDAAGILRTAPVNVARIDHDPLTGECRGLLSEEAATNLLLQSAGDSNLGNWTLGSNIVRVGNALAPDGTNTATTYSTTQPSYAYINQPVALNANTTYTLSCFARLRSGPVPTRGALLRSYPDTDGNAGTQNIVSLIYTGIDAKWRRFQLTFKNILAGTYPVYASVDFNPGIEIDIWGVQLEVGDFATSYIPTTTSQVTRAADSLTMTGTNVSSWVRDGEGTFFAEHAAVRYKDGISESHALRAYGGTGDYTTLRHVNQNKLGYYNSYSVIQGNVIDTAPLALITAGTFVKHAIAYASGDYAYSQSGSIELLAIGVPPIISSVAIGTNGAQHIKRIAYYPKRLSNTQLQALTS